MHESGDSGTGLCPPPVPRSHAPDSCAEAAFHPLARSNAPGLLSPKTPLRSSRTQPGHSARGGRVGATRIPPSQHAMDGEIQLPRATPWSCWGAGRVQTRTSRGGGGIHAIRAMGQTRGWHGAVRTRCSRRCQRTLWAEPGDAGLGRGGQPCAGRAVGVPVGRGEPIGAGDELQGDGSGRLASGGPSVRCTGAAHEADELRVEQRGLGGDGGSHIRQRSGVVRPAHRGVERDEPGLGAELGLGLGFERDSGGRGWCEWLAAGPPTRWYISRGSFLRL